MPVYVKIYEKENIMFIFLLILKMFPCSFWFAGNSMNEAARWRWVWLERNSPLI
jgi:hypothetical protein